MWVRRRWILRRFPARDVYKRQGVYSANSLRPMMEDSKLYSILTGVALVAVLLAVSSAFTIWKMRRLSPVALMKKDDAD